MNRIICLTLLVFLHFNFCQAQEIEINQITSQEELKKLIVGIHSIQEFKTDDIYIKLLEYSYVGIDLGNQPKKDVLVSDFYIYVRDPLYASRVPYYYLKGHFYNPRNYLFDEKLKTLEFTYGLKTKEQTVLLEFSNVEGIKLK